MEPAPLRYSRRGPNRHPLLRGRAGQRCPRVSRRDPRGGPGQGSRGTPPPPARPRRPAPAPRPPAPRERIARARDPGLTAAGLRGRRGDRGLAHVWGRGARRGDHAALRVPGSWVRSQAESRAPLWRWARSCAPGPSPSPPRGSSSPPAAAGTADPARRMPVIPLCRLAGVRGHGGGVRGRGRGGGDAGKWGARARRGGERPRAAAPGSRGRDGPPPPGQRGGRATPF